MPSEAPRTPATEVRFHADRRFMWAKFVVAVIFVGTPLVAGSSVSGFVIGLLVAIGLAIYGLRDVLAPVRLAADAAGVTVVSRFASQRRLAWDEVERVRLDERSRYGGRQALLEIDAGESLHFFSRYDLGMPPTEALDLVLEVRAARS
jgi:Bacterial PH domain